MTKGCEDAVAERMRQIEVEGWTEEHDDAHRQFDLSDAGICYAMSRYHRNMILGERIPCDLSYGPIHGMMTGSNPQPGAEIW